MDAPLTRQFSLGNPLVLCQASADAYRGREGHSDAVVESKLTDTSVSISVAGNYVIVAFRGTKDVRNWLTDLEVAMVSPQLISPAFADWPMEAKMHRGFLAAWLSVRNNVISTLATWPGKRLFLTGHSLGGALAMLAAADLHIAAAAQEIAGVYTFGQPRVGNKVFAQMFDMMLRDRTFRVVHRADIVPHVPWLLGRYRHAGIECFFDRDGSYRENPPWLWQTGMEALATWRGWRQYRAVDISDHFIDSYLRLFQSTAETKEAA